MPIDTSGFDVQREGLAASDYEIEQQAANGYVATPNADADLPIFAKAFMVYVPVTSDGAQVVVIPAHSQGSTLTLTLGPGNHILPLAIKRLVSRPAGVIVHAFHDQVTA